VKIVIGEPISTAGRSTRDAEELTAQLFAAIASLYFEHARQVE
jgi:hypothetical protein